MRARVFAVVGVIVLLFSGTAILAQPSDAATSEAAGALLNSSATTYTRLEQEIHV